jgi:1,4-dihydroxy-2-naphthoate octaprenyltransferase
VLGLELAVGRDDVTWWLAPFVLLAGILVQLATNVVNSVEDYVRGVDTSTMEGTDRTFVDGELSVEQGRWLYRGLFLATILLGVLMIVVTGPAILPVGFVGVLAAWSYTAGPLAYKYRALGEPTIIFLMGPLMTLGAFTAVTGDAWDTAAFVVGFVPGLLVAAVLTTNNLVDIDDDRAAGVKTVPGVLGFDAGRRLLYLELGLGYGLVPVLVAAGVLGWPALAVLATLPLAWAAVRFAAQGRAGDPALEPLLMQVVKVQAIVGLVLLVAEGVSRALDISG